MVIKFDRYFSPAGENRGIHLYLPDDYYGSQERYPVLYMFDGHNLFFDSDATFGKCLGLKDFLDHWGKKMIVVGLACATDDIQRVQEYCPYHIQSRIYGDLWGRGDETINWMVQELKPWIDQNYRTWPFREATAIAGYSMGGMMSLFTVLRYNRWFSKAAVISPALLPAMEHFKREIQDSPFPRTPESFSAGEPPRIPRKKCGIWSRASGIWNIWCSARVCKRIFSARRAVSITNPAGSSSCRCG